MDVRQLSWFPIFFPLKVRSRLVSLDRKQKADKAQDPLYLPAEAELDVHISRLTDHIKRRIWFEWSAESYLWLPLSSPTSSNGGDVLSPEPAASSANGKGLKSPRMPWGDAFSSAPSPRVGKGTMAMDVDAANMSSGPGVQRVKIGETRLANPSGRSSWVSLT